MTAPSPSSEPDLARCRYIPLRKREIVDALLADPEIAASDRAALGGLAHRFGLLFHLSFYAAREQLKDAYVRFNPDQPGEAQIPDATAERRAFLDDLHGVLVAGNYTVLGEADIDGGVDTAGRVAVAVKVPTDVFDTVRFYGRGRHQREIVLRRWAGLRRQPALAEIHDDIVLVAALRSDCPPKALRGTRLRPGAVYLKQFRDIPRADLRTLYPNARVVMRLVDQLVLGVPAVVGGIPILLNIVPTVSVLLLVAGAYLGISGTVEDDSMKKALAALSGLGALAGFLMRQWVKYERQKLRYQKRVSDNAYFNIINNNAGLFDSLIGASEDAEVKEALLAYALLLSSAEPLSREALDARVEAWLTRTFAVDVDFEIDDALAKLAQVGVLIETPDGRVTAQPLSTAAARTDAALAALIETTLAERDRAAA